MMISLLRKSQRIYNSKPLTSYHVNRYSKSVTSHHNAREQDVLREVPQHDWMKLRDLYKLNWPNYLPSYYYLNNSIQWKLKDPTFPLKIYSFDGDWSDGTYVAESILGGPTFINIDTLEPDAIRLQTALLKTRLIDWSRQLMFFGIREDLRQVVDTLRKAYSLPPKHELWLGYYWVSQEVCNDFEIDYLPDVQVQELPEDYIPLLNSCWDFKYQSTRSDNFQIPHSEGYLRELLRLNGGMGVFLKSNNEICSWILRNQYSSLSNVRTLNQYIGKGYSKLLIKTYAKALAVDGLDTHVTIEKDNHISRNIVKNLGFNYIGDMFWM